MRCRVVHLPPSSYPDNKRKLLGTEVALGDEIELSRKSREWVLFCPYVEPIAEVSELVHPIRKVHHGTISVSVSCPTCGELVTTTHCFEEERESREHLWRDVCSKCQQGIWFKVTKED